MPMRWLVIRCRSCTPAPASELTEWLEGKVAELREQSPQFLVRLARLSQDLTEATIDDGWLIEVEPRGDASSNHAVPSPSVVEQLLRDMRILGLDPVVLAPTDPPFERSLAATPPSKWRGARAARH